MHDMTAKGIAPSDVSSRMDQDDALAKATVHQAGSSRLRLARFRGGTLLYDRPDEFVLSMGVTANHALEYETAHTRASVVPLIGRFGLMTPGERCRIEMRGDCTVIQMVLEARRAGRLAE